MERVFTGWLLCCSALGLLAGCAELNDHRRVEFVPVVTLGAGPVNWLGELHEMRGLSVDELQGRQEELEREYRENSNDSNRVRLALLLANAEEPVRDQSRAERLLSVVDVEQMKPDEREVVLIHRMFLQQHGSDSRKISILWDQLTGHSKRIEELEKQLKALTQIEQNIQQREAGSSAE